MTLNFGHMFEFDTLEINEIWKMQLFPLILPKYNSIRIQYLQHWYSKCSNSKEICLAALNGEAN